MPEIKSKKSGKTWKDAQSFFNDAVSVDPSLKSHSPDDLWNAAQSNEGYEVIGAPVAVNPSVANTSPTSTRPASEFSPIKMAKNFPGSFMKQGKQMVQGIPTVIAAANPILSSHSGLQEVASKGLVPTLTSKFDQAKQIGSNVYDEYKDRYFSGNFLQRLEEDPAAIAADAASLIPLVGWGAKAAGLAKTAKTLGTVGRVADFASSPVPWAAEAVTRAPMVGNKIAKAGMTYALKLPPDTTVEAGQRLRDFTLKNRVDMGMSGRSRARKEYGKANDKLKQLETDATTAGMDINRANVSRDATSAIAKQNSADSRSLSRATDAVERKIDDQMNFGGQPVIPPTQAADIRKRMNASSAPKTGLVAHTSKESLEKQAEVAVANGIRQELGNAIPGHRETALNAMDWHDAFEAADRVQRGSRNASFIDHGQSAAMGAGVGNIFHGNLVAPAVIGGTAKFLHTPERVSKISIGLYNENPITLRRAWNKANKITPGASNLIKASAQKDPGRPFDEGQQPTDPSRPFKE